MYCLLTTESTDLYKISDIRNKMFRYQGSRCTEFPLYVLLYDVDTILKINLIHRIVKAHPAIGHAVMHIAASVTEEAALSGRGGTLGQDAPIDREYREGDVH